MIYHNSVAGAIAVGVLVVDIKAFRRIFAGKSDLLLFSELAGFSLCSTFDGSMEIE